MHIYISFHFSFILVDILAVDNSD